VVVKAKDLKVGMKVIVHEFGEQHIHALTNVQYFPPLGEKFGAPFVAVGTEEWDKGIPGLGGTFDLYEEFQIEE
jgi:hypothetical protein